MKNIPRASGRGNRLTDTSDTGRTRGIPPREWLIRAALVAMGALTATPVQSLFDPSQLENYGVTDPDPAVLTLLQHRGVLQLLVGAALVWAAFRADLRVPVAIATILSKGSYLALALTRYRETGEVRMTPVIFDTISIVLLIAILFDAVVRARRGRRGTSARA